MGQYRSRFRLRGWYCYAPELPSPTCHEMVGDGPGYLLARLWITMCPHLDRARNSPTFVASFTFSSILHETLCSSTLGVQWSSLHPLAQASPMAHFRSSAGGARGFADPVQTFLWPGGAKPKRVV